jgi:type III secretion system FlhB-like substrate exporter
LKLAEENAVPIKEEPKLAESLVDFAPGTQIPDELWEAMAEILAQIYMLDGKARS